MKKYIFAFVFCNLVNISLIVSCAYAQDYAYRIRGNGDNLRKEGLGRENVGAHFSLISVLRGASEWKNTKPSTLVVRFYMLEKATAYLRIREKVNVQTYMLDSERTQWPSGWSTFGPWSAIDVIHNTGVNIDNLGVTVTQRTTPHSSGMVYPAVIVSGNSIYGTSPLQKSEQYSFVVRSHTGLEPFKWGLYMLHQDGSQIKLKGQHDYIDKLVAGVPLEIKIDASGLQEGYYKLKMKGEYITSDHDEVVKKSFKFYHNVN